MAKLPGVKIAIIGATGNVGTVLLRLLEAQNHPAGDIMLIASERSRGRRVSYAGQQLEVQALSLAVGEFADVAVISATDEISREWGRRLSEQGTLVVDDSATFRLDEGVPLVVPEVNGEDVEWHQNIIAIPNCSVTPLALLLHPLRQLGDLARVTMATYQAVSGAGSQATEELYQQTRQMADVDFKQSAPIASKHYAKQIAFNVIPQIGSFADNGYTSEEMKTHFETKKILKQPELALSATCVRVPVEIGHSGAVIVEFDAARAVSAEAAREALASAPGVTVTDAADVQNYPTPIDVATENDVLVGRIRTELAHDNSIALWFSSDNLLKGASLNSLQIIEECHKRGCLAKARE